ncbi:hypothetical protein QBC46DRAFT_456950 [Diplogelasinospora grovesii]|uniref:NACHT domain-containing protein n=1 Tax=Diplogelasinospora grovesii TaxID=303347 RepID=A0AAN6NDX8_9PEZI|nr:hypothetical protein QBC46DRAFT_456950 [Diplogelasinospora grovesii]
MVPGEEVQSVSVATTPPDFILSRCSILLLAWWFDSGSIPLGRPPRRAALVGLGGIGKSQLAIRYAYDVRTSSPDTYVFWVHAGTIQRFEDAYRTIAERLRLPACRDADADVLRLTNGRWLMVLDNADDGRVFYAKQAGNRQPLAAYLPQSENGSILITSRNRDAATRLAGSHNNVWAVPAMVEEQALQLLRCKLGKANDALVATDLVHALDFIPLAITQAAAFIVRRAPRMSPSTYLAKLRRDRKKKPGLLGKDMGDIRRDANAYNSIIATWQLTFEAIRQQRVSAADLLAFMSFFSPQEIPDWVLRRYMREERGASLDGDCANGVNSSEDEDSDTSSNDDVLEDDLDVLATTVDRNTPEMHPMVQFCTQEWLSSTGGAPPTKRAFFRVMSREYPMGRYWTTCRALDPHIEPFEEGEPEDEGEGEDMAAVLTCAGYYRSMIGSYKAGERMLRKAVHLREIILGLENSATLTSVGTLGLVLQQQGEYEEGEEMHRRALEGREKALGAEHPDTLTSVNNLGGVLGDQGKYDEAEGMHRRALEGWEKALGAEHPWTLTSVNNLGKVLRAQGKYGEAEEMHRRALEGYEKALGAEHPDTLTSTWGLGHLLRSQSRLHESECLYDRAWEWFHAVLGSDHPTTVACGQERSSLKQEMEEQLEDARLWVAELSLASQEP